MKVAIPFGGVGKGLRWRVMSKEVKTLGKASPPESFKGAPDPGPFRAVSRGGFRGFS